MTRVTLAEPGRDQNVDRLADEICLFVPEELLRSTIDERDLSLRADRLLKSASLDERQIMEELLLRLQQRAHKVAA